MDPIQVVVHGLRVSVMYIPPGKIYQSCEFRFPEVCTISFERPEASP